LIEMYHPEYFRAVNFMHKHKHRERERERREKEIRGVLECMSAVHS
jgi:hypothetical protein